MVRRVLTPGGARYVSIAAGLLDIEGIQSTMTYGQSPMSPYYKTLTGSSVARTPELRELGLKVFAYATRLLEEGKLKPPPIDLRENGLEGALQGIQDLMQQKISGKKVVCRM